MVQLGPRLKTQKYRQATADVFQSLWMLLLTSVMSDTHLTSLHECCVPFLSGSSAIGEKALLSGTHRDYTNTCVGQNTHIMKTFYLSIVIFHWLYTWFKRGQM